MDTYYPTHQYQVNKPDITVTRDRRGVKLQSGLRVAYNRSGEIHLGTIVSYKTSWVERLEYYYNQKVVNQNAKKDWGMSFKMVIQSEDGSQSTVKNPRSFLVI